MYNLVFFSLLFLVNFKHCHAKTFDTISFKPTIALVYTCDTLQFSHYCMCVLCVVLFMSKTFRIPSTSHSFTKSVDQIKDSERVSTRQI